jgi:hypothetical protein
MAHYLTNRGKYQLLQGQWADAGATAIKIGLLNGTSIPGALTEAAIQDVNTVTELLALTGVDEPTQAWYVGRKDLSRTALEEDDTNNRIDMAIAAVVWDDATAGGGETHVYGAFWYDATTDTNDGTRLVMGVATFTAIPLNGSDFQINAGDLVRAS